jgi:carboxylesterase type B
MPFVPSDESNSKKSVILWIHGGGYLGGQGMAYDGSYLAGIGNVIVVAINYRLEAFGFFSTGDDVAPGNYGLWDQKMAIQWVHDNIDSFGGDANSITLAGESAGGFSVALQALHPSNKGLFHRVIAQSGVSNSMTTFDNARSTAKLISKSLNCSTDLNSETMMCIRGKSFDDIHDAFMALPTRLPGSLDIHVALTLAPVVDGVFLKDSAENILMGDSSGSLDFSSPWM